MEYVAIAIHAISKDRSAFPHDCLYLQASCKLDSDEEKSGSEEEEEDEYPITEIRFVPQDPTKLKEMYDALCHCQALHPDPDDSNSEDSEAPEEFEEGDDFYGDEPDTEFLTIQQQATLDRYDSLLAAGEAAREAENGTAENQVNGTGDGESMETGQFEDANDEAMQ
ncbi:methylosome subunit pICln-like isoform X2 [Lineus longissimus]